MATITDSSPLRDKIAAALQYNDDCGVGPQKWDGYLQDADVIVGILRDALLSDEALEQVAGYRPMSPEDRTEAERGIRDAIACVTTGEDGMVPVTSSRKEGGA